MGCKGISAGRLLGGPARGRAAVTIDHRVAPLQWQALREPSASRNRVDDQHFGWHRKQVFRAA